MNNEAMNNGAMNNGGTPHILIAGMGNILRRDDGFGVEVTHRLQAANNFPPNVTVIEVGTGGISLVQELMSPLKYDVLVLVDATDRKGEPGQVYLLEAEVPELDTFPEEFRRDFLADMHYAVPSRAMILAKALNILPAKSFIVGCQPSLVDEFAMGLTDPVKAGVEVAIERINVLVTELMEKSSTDFAD
jgi:hydrogenase maturation protease